MQPHRTRKREAEPIDLSAPCCEPIVFARFPPEGQVEVFDRHTGPRCAGTFDRLAYNAWFYQGRHYVQAYNVTGITNG